MGTGMAYSGDMPEIPWNARVYRNRHGRGVRTPMFGMRLPRYRTSTGIFDDLLAAHIRRLNEAWPKLIQPLQFAVEDVPPSDPTPWENEPNVCSRLFAAGHGVPTRIVLYRLPLQSRARGREELQWAIRDELVARIAQLYGRRPEEIDPDYRW